MGNFIYYIHFFRDNRSPKIVIKDFTFFNYRRNDVILYNMILFYTIYILLLSTFINYNDINNIKQKTKIYKLQRRLLTINTPEG